MTDLLERAHNKSPYLQGSSAERLIDELADEIEHLRQLVALAQELEREQSAEIERLTAALQLSQSQNYCTLCGRALEPKPCP